DLDVTLLSSEGRKRGSPRQWVVVRDGTGLRTAIEGTPLGLRVLKLQFQALPLAQNWFRNMATGQTPAAYLETVDPARREPLFAEAESRLALSDLAALPCLEFGGPNLAPGQLAVFFLPGFRQFLKGDWLRDDPQTLWAKDDKTRTEFSEAVRKALGES